MPNFASGLRQIRQFLKRKRWRAAKPFRWGPLSTISRLVWQGSPRDAHENEHGARRSNDSRAR